MRSDMETVIGIELDILTGNVNHEAYNNREWKGE